MPASSERGNLHLFPEPRLDRLYEIHHCDAFEWLRGRNQNSIHAVVTDPPYGLLEYTDEQKRKLRIGRGGVWRIPPSFDGCVRRPLPRFTILKEQHKGDLEAFFSKFAALLMPVLVPGAHVFVATNPLVSHLVYGPFIRAGFEKRGEFIRVVQTLRGGDRPKNAHREFPDVSVMPRSCWEPWGLFRKPCEGRVQDNLRKWKTGRPPPHFSDSPVPRRHLFQPHATRRTPSGSTPVAETSTVCAAACPCRAAIWCGRYPRPFYGFRFDNGGIRCAGLEKHRTGDRPGILRNGPNGDSEAGRRRHRRWPWNQKAASAHGNCSRTMIIRGGTSSGDIW